LSTLYIRLPSKAAADNAPNLHALACPFAVAANGKLPHGGTIERQGTASLSDLSDTVAKSQRVVLLLAAGDVTILRVQVPPLSSARLKTALPNLVEDRLITDPSDCVVVAGGLFEGLRAIAVVQRVWLDMLVKTLIAFGARHIAALPAQLCLPYQSDQPGSVTAAIDDQPDTDQNAGIDMTLRLSEQDGIGLAIAHEKDGPAAHVAIQTLCALVPEAQVTLYVPQAQVHAYQEAVDDIAASNKAAQGQRITVSADNWSQWIAGANGATLDLMAGSGMATGPKLSWRPWRWPLALAAAILVINVAALNIDWWRLKRESDALRTDMIRIYKSAYPKESVIIDPLAQMQQKISAARHDAGQAAPDDFTAVTAAFADAWANVVAAAGKNAAIAALDYRERSLYVRLKPGGESPTEQMKAALSKYGLALELAPEQSAAIVWRIRSAK
jgi:general secretion pathway protein L